MKILNKNELEIAEGVLFKHLPQSYKVYGYLYNINRNKPTTQEVVVDSWPKFKVIICRPDLKIKGVLESRKRVACYGTEEQALRKMLMDDNVIDWSLDFMTGGFDLSQAPILKEVSSVRDVKFRYMCAVHLVYLADSSHLLTPTVDNDLESRISSLDISHVDLVNKTWKFGGNEQSYNTVKHFISNYPSYCITDGQDQPVSWILLYEYCAMGLLYTVPEHRGKGYAKVLVSTMAKRLRAEGHPVFCFIEEDNIISYRLFKNLGFTEDPSYRAGWIHFNYN
uniref:glycine-N-acyltransferase-like protein 3 n=1 Tax=Solea senegalensis TaxID=28829 RepID=UPI001CD84D21|nr:glycine-N-acyltransferase-like protein 3 [Solea senegalensis]